ncbi:hypothetical protein Q4F19_07980 [Sphingomonas sp. BIUV-7]|uniref:MarR family transcriptional regulator n=1 Tax=Sphingomonas natans TaxID=3063330 RepID=A0ABT8Y7N1_9SPHN|nr:hypothetical protein [Sphingomonas sp. BIUV-7]MDO6414318.1 hypothetical protein [Sphingomonas sp. BIUV-7]
MARPLPDLSAPDWTPKLATTLERAAGAIARLDARLSVTSVRSPWALRASWSGFAAALRLQGAEIDEIDIFGRACGVSLPARPSIRTTFDELDDLAPWQAALRERAERHWRDDAPFSTVVAADWRDRPVLLQALEIAARHARADRSIAPWLAFPILLRTLGLSRAPLPCLVVGDRAFRLAPRDTDAIVPRYLRAIAEAADNGLVRLQALEDDRVRAAAAVHAAHRPGQLLTLMALLQFRPAISPRGAAAALRLSLSGAGKLLSRSAELGLVVEISGRQAWRTYLAPDLAVTFGFRSRAAGRPPSPPRVSALLEPTLAAFDAEMAALDATLARLGLPVPAVPLDAADA